MNETLKKLVSGVLICTTILSYTSIFAQNYNFEKNDAESLNYELRDNRYQKIVEYEYGGPRGTSRNHFGRNEVKLMRAMGVGVASILAYAIGGGAGAFTSAFAGVILDSDVRSLDLIYTYTGRVRCTYMQDRITGEKHLVLREFEMEVTIYTGYGDEANMLKYQGIAYQRGK